MFKKATLIALSAVSVFAMHSAEVNINNSDIELSARLDMGQFNESVEPNTIFLGARYLHADERHSDVNSIDDFQEINFLMQKNVNSDFRLGLGIKANYTKNFVSIPLGVEASYKLPFSSSVPFYIGASIYVAPEVLSFDKADNFLEYQVNVEAEAIKNGFITLGYRHIDTNYKNWDVEYNESLYFGLKFLF
ncbi:YfaZ family outer membrane protein [Sulfurimonas sp.]|jgi:hypothetical protein|uniref:YfaZ family outer membrane protein n=1 Tax=Sulfurimonas sp. TaxID=2022749 RepID=UPI0025D9C58B|nr:YfaZ family outer membrane protein [Sulfurimonas sp.]MCK9473420.1 YfaZ family outer membrane protein [Sulfurimonas sp.]MDD3505374.1 YfaZ family outer membrane protein [Sulfurimonas sp.]